MAADLVARAVLEKYEDLDVRDDDWNVVAGLVLEESTGLTVLSVATGCKCVGGVVENRSIVRDAHAEVLARRALRRALMEDRSLVQRIHEGRLHLYTSSPPCGDAAIFAKDDGTTAFTGAKLPDWRREQDQVLGATRLKPARSDATKRSLCLSCTDKLCKWAVTGLEGALLGLDRSLFLSSLVIGASDSHAGVLAAAKRGIVDRSLAMRRDLDLPSIPGLGVATTTILPTFRSTKKSHIAACWWRGLAHREVLVAATGRPLGVNATSTKRSLLSTAAFVSDHQVDDYAAWKATRADLSTAVAAIQLNDFPPDHPLRLKHSIQRRQRRRRRDPSDDDAEDDDSEDDAVGGGRHKVQKSIDDSPTYPCVMS